ncbi:MAG: phosphatase PAP2 family protein [Sphingosinicella sp.]
MDITLEDHRRAFLLAATVALASLFAVPPLAGFSVDFGSFWQCLCILPFIPWIYWRRLDAMIPAVKTMAIGLVLIIPVVMLTYAAMRLGMPLSDQLLIAIDNGLGFDWPVFLAVIDRSPFLASVLSVAYLSFGPQLFLLPAMQCIAGLAGRAYQLTLAWLLLCALATAVAIFFPAEGAFVGHGIDWKVLANVNAGPGVYFLESFHAVRDQRPFELGFFNAGGLVTFPSIHAGAALLCTWAAWPVRVLRYPFLVLNLLMFISALVPGGHYFVDLPAGIAVAVFALHLSGRLALVSRVIPPDFQRRALSAA